MSENKKYYYLKLRETFFNGEDQKLLESMKNGSDYQNLYLRMCCLALKSDGALIFKDRLPYDITMLSTVLSVNIDTIKTGLDIFKKIGLVEISPDGTIFMSDIQELIGHSSSEAERKAKYRAIIERSKDNSGTLSLECPGQFPPELDINTELEREGTKETKSPKLLEEFLD